MSPQHVAGQAVPFVVGAQLGMAIPVGPAGVAVLTALLVRLMVMTKRKPGTLYLEVLTTLLSMLFAVVTCDGHPTLSALNAAEIGLGYGVLGVGILEVGKSKLGKVLGGAVQFALRGMLDKGPTP